MRVCMCACVSVCVLILNSAYIFASTLCLFCNKCSEYFLC